MSYNPHDWQDIPATLLNDKMIQFLVAQRSRAAKTIDDANECIRAYIIKNTNESPENLLSSITLLQAKVLSFIIKKYQTSGVSPTSQEIQDHMNFVSLNSAVTAVESLCKKGYLQKTKGQWRSIIPYFNSKRERVAITESKK